MERGTIEIFYCAKCKWLARAAWLAQEILTTFENELESVAIKPGSTGQFDVVVNNQVVFSRNRDKSSPEPKQIKQMVRDIVCPGKSLGHIDS